MPSHLIFGFIVACSLSVAVSGARIKVSGPNEKKGGGNDCKKEVATRIMELIPRIDVYFQKCGLGHEHAPSFVVTEDGEELICKSSCQGNPTLTTEPPDNSALLAACPDDKNSVNFIRLHDAFDAVRKSCASVEETPLIDLEHDEESGGKDEVVDVPVESPKAPMQGNKIKQLAFEYELKNSLADRSQGVCAKLQKAFKKCDFRRIGTVTKKQVSDMLDKLDAEKAESMELLERIAANVGKSPEDPLTFQDWLP
jgi:hypothetical protein